MARHHIKRSYSHINNGVENEPAHRIDVRTHIRFNLGDHDHCVAYQHLGGGTMDIYLEIAARLDANYDRAVQKMKRLVGTNASVSDQIGHVKYMQGLSEARLIVTQAAKEALGV
jgi:hypothetical protein